MFLTIDPNNGVAIYEQIVRQVSFAVAGPELAKLSPAAICELEPLL